MHETAKRLYEAALILSKGKKTQQGEVASFFGATPQKLKNWESRGVSNQGMVEICEKHPISLPWLTRGDGNMLRGEAVDPNTIDGEARWLDEKGPSDAISYTSLADQRQQNLTGSSQAWNVTNWGDLPDKGAVMVPMLAIGEDGAVALDRDGCEPMSARDLKRKRLSPPHAAWMAAPDNGMEPAIWEDETVVIDTSQTTVRDGKIYAVFYAGSVKLRRVFITPTGGMTIKPENPAFEVIELEKEDVHTVKVIGLYGFHITSLA